VSKLAIISISARIFGCCRVVKAREGWKYEALGLPHVDDAPEAVLHEIDPRTVGQAPDLFLEGGGVTHGSDGR
jgi:hypothetical protein